MTSLGWSAISPSGLQGGWAAGSRPFRPRSWTTWLRTRGRGNVREMQNVIERAVILSPGRSLRVPLGDLQSPATQVPVPAVEPVTLADAEREHIPRRPPRNRVGGRRSERGRGSPRNEAFHFAEEDKKAQHFSPPVVPAGWQLCLPGGTRPVALHPPIPRSFRPIRSATHYSRPLYEAKRRSSPCWHGPRFRGEQVTA